MLLKHTVTILSLDQTMDSTSSLKLFTIWKRTLGLFITKSEKDVDVRYYYVDVHVATGNIET